MNHAARTAAQRAQELDRRLGIDATSIKRLEATLLADYSVEGWGLGRLHAITDEEHRTVASDLILSAVQGVGVNLRHLVLCEHDVRELVGPNGRTMPGPETTVDELIARKRLDRAFVDLLRALGSTLDCMAAAAIGITGLPTGLHTAAAAKLFSIPDLDSAAPASQRAARDAFASAFARHAHAEPRGWLAWALELRNAVIHRGHLTRTWMRRPSSGASAITLATRVPDRYALRFEPHLRAKPWQPDILALTGSEPIWLPEPAQATAAELSRRTVTLVEDVAETLTAIATGPVDDWVFPESRWTPERDPTRPQVREADQFAGFDTGYPTPVANAMAVHRDSTARLSLAERLRVRLGTTAPSGHTPSS